MIMAVVMSSKFYKNNLWKDISKIVFTSPNMDSPSIAGTRSHILPGEGEIGTWYEDTSQMFRVEDNQYTTESDFFNYRMKCKETKNLLDGSGFIDVKQINYPSFDTFVKDSSGVDIVGYDDSTGYVVNSTVRLEYTPIHKNLDEISVISTDMVEEVVSRVYRQCTPPEDGSYLYYYEYLYRDSGWYTPVISDFTNCHLTFQFSNTIRISAISMESIQVTTNKLQKNLTTNCGSVTDGTLTSTTKRYFIGNFTIQASNDQVTWTTISTSSNTNNTTKFVYISNNSYYKFYRISITNNTGLNTTTFDNTFYGIRKLRFYTYKFSTSPGNNFVHVYEYSDPDDPKIFKISNAYSLESNTPEYSSSSTTTNIAGNIRSTDISGIEPYSIYDVDIKSVTDPYNYLTLAECVSQTVSGIGLDNNSSIYVKLDKKTVVSSSSVEFLNLGTVNEQIFFQSSGSHSVVVDNPSWVGTAAITYEVTASGVRSINTNNYNVTGVATRLYESELYSRRDSFRLIVADVVTGGTIEKDANLYVWGNNERPLDLDTMNSIVFEVSIGEAYNCRLTAWDDVTHSTTNNELIRGDHVRCSAMAYCAKGTKINPTESKKPFNLVYPPAHNVIFKGNTFDSGYKFYYGDFDLVYRYQSDIFGDFLLFKPMLYGIDNSIPYGVHDYVITLHYSYT
jgi:hypothetical protein